MSGEATTKESHKHMALAGEFMDGPKTTKRLRTCPFMFELIEHLCIIICYGVNVVSAFDVSCYQLIVFDVDVTCMANV